MGAHGWVVRFGQPSVRSPSWSWLPIVVAPGCLGHPTSTVSGRRSCLPLLFYVNPNNLSCTYHTNSLGSSKVTSLVPPAAVIICLFYDITGPKGGGVRWVHPHTPPSPPPPQQAPSVHLFVDQRFGQLQLGTLLKEHDDQRSFDA